MSATERLRAMLDELGVEWTAPNSCLRDEMTSWAAGGFYYDAFEVPEPDGTFLLTAAHQDDLTPEQAVEATLGSDLEAENAKLRELVRGLDYCAHEAYGMCARVPVGGVRPFTCCPLFDFDSGEYGCKKLTRELGIEVDA